MTAVTSNDNQYSLILLGLISAQRPGLQLSATVCNRSSPSARLHILQIKTHVNSRSLIPRPSPRSLLTSFVFTFPGPASHPFTTSAFGPLLAFAPPSPLLCHSILAFNPFPFLLNNDMVSIWISIRRPLLLTCPFSLLTSSTLIRAYNMLFRQPSTCLTGISFFYLTDVVL